MKLFLLNIIILSFAGIVSGQESAISYPALSVIIDSALKNSNILKIKEKDIEKIIQESKIDNRKWIDYIYLDGSSKYGLLNQVVINEQSTNDVIYSGLLSKSEQFQYYGGISVKIPISSFLNKKNEATINKLTIAQTRNEMQEAKNEIRRMITEEYYRLKYLEESMNTFQNIYQTLYISYLKAIKDLENGKIELDDFSTLVTAMGKAKDSHLKAKNSFYSQFHTIQLISGISFNINVNSNRNVETF